MLKMRVDTTAWNKRLQDLAHKADRAWEKGVAEAAGQLLNDAVMQEPTVPLKEGTLRASGSVHVDRKFVDKSPDPDGVGTPNTGEDDTVKRSRNKVVGTVGFNTPYAARLHEHPEFEFTEPGSGGKFLSSKLEANQKDYREVMVRRIRKEVGL